MSRTIYYALVERTTGETWIEYADSNTPLQQVRHGLDAWTLYEGTDYMAAQKALTDEKRAAGALS